MLDPGWAASLMCLDLSLISITSHPHLNLSSPFLPLLATSLEFTGRLFWEVPPLLFNHQARSLASPCHLSATKWLSYHKRTRLITGTLLYACEVDPPPTWTPRISSCHWSSTSDKSSERRQQCCPPAAPSPTTNAHIFLFFPSGAAAGTQQPGRAGLGAGANEQLTIVIV